MKKNLEYDFSRCWCLLIAGWNVLCVSTKWSVFTKRFPYPPVGFQVRGSQYTLAPLALKTLCWLVGEVFFLMHLPHRLNNLMRQKSQCLSLEHWSYNAKAAKQHTEIISSSSAEKLTETEKYQRTWYPREVTMKEITVITNFLWLFQTFKFCSRTSAKRIKSKTATSVEKILRLLIVLLLTW